MLCPTNESIREEVTGTKLIAPVPGGSRGIGAAVALRLARDGMDVAVTYVGSSDRAKEVVAEIEGLGPAGIF